mmetsp:Transcript_50423/g.107390  ORF Transcript_50423/g.107390 Transcript_50423/m.107390 type:complete len:409 (+) Transcript_50423:101-1327(+)
MTAIRYCFVPLALLCQCDALSPPSSNTRRDFLESVAAASSAAATATTASFPNLANAAVEEGSFSSFSSSLSLSSSDDRPLSLPPLGLGAWAWGDSIFWGYDRKNDEDLREVFDYALAKDLAFFDTAELYGLGRSEELLGKFRKEGCATKEEEEKVVIASKFAALPWRTKREDVVKACEASVKRLGGRPIDLYQIHFPNAWSNAEYWDGLADAADRGLVKSVGVSNYGVDALRACHARLSERGIKLATNQIQMSLLYRWPIENGLLDACRELDVKVLSYSPLALGFLTGKYNREYLPSGPRSKIAEQLFQDGAYEGLLGTMKDVAGRHGDAPLSQVAINWAIAKGTVPIPGARNLRQVKQNLDTLDWSLTAEEERMLDDASARVTGFITPDKNPFPRKDVNTGLVMYDS